MSENEQDEAVANEACQSGHLLGIIRGGTSARDREVASSAAGTIIATDLVRLLRVLRTQHGGAGPGRMLDVGCGMGEVSKLNLPLSLSYYSELAIPNF